MTRSATCRPARFLFGALTALLALLLYSKAASAHALNPALLSLDELSPGRFEVAWKTTPPVDEGFELTPVLPARCKALTEPVAREVPNGIIERWTVDCGAEGLVRQRVEVKGLEFGTGEVLVHITLAGGRVVEGVLRSGAPALEIPEQGGHVQILRSYVALGVEHILTGYDHLLFVLALVLLIRGRAALIKAITAFTAAHSVTLSLATLRLVRFPTAPVEASIALSIFFLAVELTRPRDAPPSLAARYPWAVAFAFGLLHGFGFAGALAGAGLPEGEIPLALLSFNAGVELGQLAFVLAILASAALARRLPQRVMRLGPRALAYGIGGLAAFWCIERMAAL